MINSVLTGPFLTRAEAAARLGTPAHDLLPRRDLLRLGDGLLEETYFAFQFDRSGLRNDLAEVVAELADGWTQLAIADWLVRANTDLAALSPLAWLDAGRATDSVLKAARAQTPRTAAATVPAPTMAHDRATPKTAQSPSLRPIGMPAPAA